MRGPGDEEGKLEFDVTQDLLIDSPGKKGLLEKPLMTGRDRVQG